MSDDLTQRADDFERRVGEAGGTDAIIGGLVRGAERNRKVTVILAISIAFDVCLSVALAMVAFDARHDANEADRRGVVACIQSSNNSLVTNALLTELIQNAATLGNALSPAEIKARVAGYEDLIIKVPNCYARPSAR